MSNTPYVWTSDYSYASVVTGSGTNSGSVSRWEATPQTSSLTLWKDNVGPLAHQLSITGSLKFNGAASKPWLSQSSTPSPTPITHFFAAISASAGTCGVPVGLSNANNHYFLAGLQNFWVTTVATGSVVTMAARIATGSVVGWKTHGVNIVHIEYRSTSGSAPLIGFNSASTTPMTVYAGTNQLQQFNSKLHVGRRSNNPPDEASFNGFLFEFRFFSSSLTNAETASIIASMSNNWLAVS